MTTELVLFVLIIGLALAFDFLNGMNDAANSIATIVSTRVLKPRWAVAWAAFFNFIAAFGFGTYIAKAISGGIVKPDVLDNWVLLSTLVGAVIWTHVCTQLGLPISVSHSLIGGLIGAGITKGGLDALIIANFLQTKIFTTALFIVLSPLIGLALGLAIMVVTLWVVRRQPPIRVDKWFRKLQLLSAAAFSFGHGTNDAQKTMGIIVGLLYATNLSLPTWLYDRAHGMYVPFWVVILCHFFIAMGTLFGGWKVIRTLGIRVTKLQPIGGFCAETAAAMTLMFTANFGIPVSTTHTITGAIMGVGTAKRLSAVRWGVARRIIWAWLLTIPCSALVAAAVYWLLARIR